MFVKKLTRQVICNPDEPVVSLKKGKLRGLIVDGTYIFRGVKYADAKRFELPKEVEAWEGTKDAIVYGTVCPEVKTVQPHDNYNVPHVFYPQDEDCQYLNIWTQSTDSSAKRPVMVWLHGGGYATGSGIEHFAYDGENMSRYGNVVVVTLNHRLNVLGFLNLSKYGEKYKYSGNLGMIDIVAALEWIRDNIAAFGGDPDNVTIFGQSGGGGKVATLLQMPEADGLFHRAIIESGVTRNFIEQTVEASLETADKIVKNLGLGKDNIDEIQNIPYFRLAKAVAESGDEAGMGFGPIPDGERYVGSAFEVGIREHAKQIPLIVGTVFGEFVNNFNRTVDDGMKNRWDEEKRLSIMNKVLGDSAEGVIEAFKKAYPRKNIVDALFVDTMFRRGALEYAELRAKAGCTNTYNYVFALESNLYGGTVPWHNAEIPYVFHNADYLEPSYIPGITEWLQDIMCSAWTTFAEKGVPQSAGMPDWLSFTEGRAATMIFDTDLRLEYAHDIDLILRLEKAELKGMKPISRSLSAKHFGGGPRV